MPRLNSVIRRYTPPTCTLEILARKSPLSMWMGQTILKQLRFQLFFDDPALAEAEKISIKGDRDQLEALCNAVTNYVQEILQKSADSFCVTFLESPELEDVVPKTSFAENKNSSGMGILEATIYLESSDNLTHKLYLGSLANPTSGSIIQLTLLQLFDLANALDEYATDVIALPNLKPERSIFSLPVWTPVAAMLVLAVGLTPVTWQYAQNIKQNQQQSLKNATSTSEKVALKPTPSLNLPTPPTGLNSPNNLPSVPPKLNPPNNLTSPPASSNTALLPKLDISPLPADSTLNPKPFALPNSTVPTAIKPIPKNALVKPQLAKPVPPTTLKIPLSRTPNPTPNSLGIIKQKDISLGTSEKLPNRNTNSIASIPIPKSVSNLPNVKSQLPEQISSQLNSQPLDKTNNFTNQTSAPVSANDLVAKLRASKKTPLPTEIAAEENKLFDKSQVAEVRAYLQKSWQPPAGFSQTLEYSLMLDIDGSIERILPLNKAAREYIDTTGIPGIGKPFVSINKTGQSLRIRVVLSPDGKVQTFLEQP